MPPKKTPTPAAAPPSAVKSSIHSSANAAPTKTSSALKSPEMTSPSNSSVGSIRNAQDAQQIALSVWNNYVDATPQRTKLLDAFMVFLMLVGALQFVYCVIAGNYVRDIF